MKATIKANGTLLIEPENGLEAYALDKWGKANLGDWGAAMNPCVNMTIDLSAFPAAMGVFNVGSFSK